MRRTRTHGLSISTFSAARAGPTKHKERQAKSHWNRRIPSLSANSRVAAKDSFAATRLVWYTKRGTTAFSRGYDLTPLRGYLKSQIAEIGFASALDIGNPDLKCILATRP